MKYKNIKYIKNIKYKNLRRFSKPSAIIGRMFGSVALLLFSKGNVFHSFDLPNLLF